MYRRYGPHACGHASLARILCIYNEFFEIILHNSSKFGCSWQSAGYVARSAFKLLEIQEKHKIIPPGGRVLDLGCHPGAWLQVACQSLGPPKRGGLVIGVDIQVWRRRRRL
jgi:23S rRNA U2552 (ribose-2'-O)-methylase RlmE/FtsJ